MLYVSEYLDYNGSAVDSGPDNTTDDSNGDSHNNDQPDDPQDPPEDTQDPPQTVTEEAIPEDPAVETVPEDQPQSNVDTSLFAFRLTGESVSMVNNGVMVTATDQGDQVSRMSDADEVRVTLHGVGRVSKKSFRKVDFKSGSIQFIVNSSDAGTARVEVGKSVHEITFVDRVSPIASLRIDTDGAFQKGQVEIIRLIALDDSGNPTPVVNFAGSISVQAKQGDARFTPDRLAVNDFVNGIAEVRMMANSESPIVIRAQNGAIIGESNTLSAEARQQFTDVTKAHPNYEAIKYLHDQSIITGYSDGSFRPADTVNRVEALKMLMLAFGLEAGPVGQLPFTDTQDSAWYAPTLGTAIDKQIVKGYEDGTFRPDKTVNKAEYLKMLFLTGGITPENDLSANPYSDVPKDAWYAPFAYLTNKMNLLDVPTGRLSAGSGMTRGDVAETIYRLKYVQDHDLLTYSK